MELDDSMFDAKRGHGSGCALMWRRDMSYHIQPLTNLGSNRVCVVKACLSNITFYIIAVYLPYYGCSVADFRNELSVLENVITQCYSDGEILIIGDMNSHIGKEHGCRGWGKTSENGKLLINTMTKYDMIVSDLGDKGDGPNYTYSSSSGRSYIDHCIVSRRLHHMIKKCVVQDDHICNVSDHLALSVVIDLSYSPVSNGQKRRKVAWKKMSSEDIETLYTSPLEEAMERLLAQHGIEAISLLNDQTANDSYDAIDIEELVRQLSYTINIQSCQLPQVKNTNGIKPYWDNELKNLSHEKKTGKK